MDDNEPAFPRNYSSEGHNGMTLRDYFAAKAMQMEMMSARARYDSGDIEADEWPIVQKWVAEYAYYMADRMLEARVRA
jgi:hypothetical protein